MYHPHEFTHQGVTTDQGIAKGTRSGFATYPGMIAGHVIDKNSVRRYLTPVRDFQLATGARIFVGEFSAIRWAPGAARYLEDCISIFEEYGWDWTYHAFREWPGWSVEHADSPVDLYHHPRSAQPTARQQLLRKWFSKNELF